MSFAFWSDACWQTSSTWIVNFAPCGTRPPGGAPPPSAVRAAGEGAGATLGFGCGSTGVADPPTSALTTFAGSTFGFAIGRAGVMVCATSGFVRLFHQYHPPKP